MIRTHAGPTCGLAVFGRLGLRVATPDERPAAASLPLAADATAVELVRSLNLGDAAGFRRLVAPVVRLDDGAGGGELVEAGELFCRLTTLAPGQTLCAARVRGAAGGVRVDLDVAWPAGGAECVSSLGCLDLTVVAGRVTALALVFPDGDLSIERAVRAFGARSSVA